jgi:hypothetical protein
VIGAGQTAFIGDNVVLCANDPKQPAVDDLGFPWAPIGLKDCGREPRELRDKDDDFRQSPPIPAAACGP